MITCIVQRGKADVVVQAAHDAGAQAATIYYGYGTGIREQLGLLGLAVDVEKEWICLQRELFILPSWKKPRPISRKK